MDPLTIATLMSSLFGGLGGLLGGGGSDQERESFLGSNIDPRDMLSRTFGSISKMGSALDKRALGGVKLRGVNVQTPKGFKGGGLPMSIGLSGVDPAIADPSILSRPGIELGDMFPDPHQYDSDVRTQIAKAGQAPPPHSSVDHPPSTDTAVPRGTVPPPPATSSLFPGIGRASGAAMVPGRTNGRKNALSALRLLGAKV